MMASAGSILSFLYFFFSDQILLYGDAVAHINIARRVFDSRTPGPQQLGTVWLPLQHMLTIPFITWDWAWRTGAGGSVVSMAAYVAAAMGIARLFWGGGVARSVLWTSRSLRWAGWIAALVYLANPNLMYLQSTAMNEPLAMALAIWTIVFYGEFARGLRSHELNAAGEKLQGCAIALAGGMLTRYDAWMLAALIGAAVSWQLISTGGVPGALRRPVRNTIILVALAPALWLAYNLGTYGNPLEFATGPYSARAIAQRSQSGGESYPGEHNPRLAAIYYLKAAELNAAPQRMPALFVATVLLGSAAMLWGGNLWLLAMFWSPAFFYPLSMAYGSVPIFMPVWWPFSYYNTRYGIQLLPLFAVALGFVLVNCLVMKSRTRAWLAGLLIVLPLAGYLYQWRETPVVLREARVNAETRVAFETQLALALEKLPQGTTLLIYTANHVGALQRAGIHLRRAITENNYMIWQGALQRPAQEADYVVAMEGDPVWLAAERDKALLEPVTRVAVKGQPAAVIYKSKTTLH